MLHSEEAGLVITTVTLPEPAVSFVLSKVRAPPESALRRTVWAPAAVLGEVVDVDDDVLLELLLLPQPAAASTIPKATTIAVRFVPSI